MAISKKYFYGFECHRYCDTPELIENFDKAIVDTETWFCHHKLEAFFSSEELRKMGRYYHVPARELVFVKGQKEHYKWPHKCMRDFSDERKYNISNATKKAMASFSEEKKKSIIKKEKEHNKTNEAALAYKLYNGNLCWNDFQKEYWGSRTI